jgi:UDPglucose 6-dehydrogenase
MKKIAIIGYGVVGKGMKKLLDNHFEVVFFDPLQEGSSTKEECNTADLAIVCVPTPMAEDGSCDISFVEESVAWLETELILIKSTIAPGTTAYLREKYNKKVNFSPEYMGESSYFTPFWKYPDPTRAETHTFVIVGGDEASQILDVFLKCMSVDTHYVVATAEEAELTKYMENTFFATKVSFCNEFLKLQKPMVWITNVSEKCGLWILVSIQTTHLYFLINEAGQGSVTQKI